MFKTKMYSYSLPVFSYCSISQFVSKKYVNCNEDVNVPRLGHNRS